MREVAESKSAATDALERRVRRLEAQVETLADAIEILARGLETGPLTEPEGDRAGDAAREARELLLLVRRGRRGD
jgi:hypothetical protein